MFALMNFMRLILMLKSICVGILMSNSYRTSLLNHFCTVHNLHQLDILHPTYHHFTGGGLSDSHLDRLLYPGSALLPEFLSSIYCKLENPLINSHHDLLLSVFSLYPLQEDLISVATNTIAPQVKNTRTKVCWSDAGITKYQELVQPHLHRIQDLWLNPASKSSMSMLLQSTHQVMSSAVAMTNKSIAMNVFSPPKSKEIPKGIRKS